MSKRPVYRPCHTLQRYSAVFKICADGASTQLFNLSQAHPNADEFIPSAVVGDFDSVDREIVRFYQEQGVEILKQNDQNTTDFEKAVLYLLKEMRDHPEHKVDCIVVVEGLGGRFDHAMSVINVLHRLTSLTSVPIYVVSGCNVAFLLQAGEHSINVSSGLEAGQCGLIPFSGPTLVSTQGLRWNLDRQLLAFDGLLSTSNGFAGSQSVTVSTDRPILWTMSVRHQPEIKKR